MPAELTHDELRGITSTSNDAVASLEKPYKWLHSYVAGDKIYCFHQAEDAEVIREHAAPRRLPGQPRRRGHVGVRQHRPAGAAPLTCDGLARPPRSGESRSST